MSTHINSILNLTIVCYHLDEYSRFWKEGGLNLDLEAKILEVTLFFLILFNRDLLKLNLTLFFKWKKKSSKLFLECAMFFVFFLHTSYTVHQHIQDSSNFSERVF